MLIYNCAVIKKAEEERSAFVSVTCYEFLSFYISLLLNAKVLWMVARARLYGC